MSKQRGEKQFCGAIDIGGTKISAALFTSDGTMSGKRKVPVDKEGGEKVAGQAVELIQDLVSRSSEEGGRLSALGICVPGVVYHDSGVVWAPNIAGWRHYHLRSKIQEKTKLPLLLESDRSAYVIGEQWRGIAEGLKNIIFLAVGTGIGAGLMIDGRICRGSEDIAGAVGWFALNPDYKPEYAEMGCFEAEASGNSVARRAMAMLKSGEPSLMREMVGGKNSNVYRSNRYRSRPPERPPGPEDDRADRPVSGNGDRQSRQPAQSRDDRPGRRTLSGGGDPSGAGEGRVQKMGPTSGRRNRPDRTLAPR